jgi:hypothetical protein
MGMERSTLMLGCITRVSSMRTELSQPEAANRNHMEAAIFLYSFHLPFQGWVIPFQEHLYHYVHGTPTTRSDPRYRIKISSNVICPAFRTIRTVMEWLGERLSTVPGFPAFPGLDPSCTAVLIRWWRCAPRD